MALDIQHMENQDLKMIAVLLDIMTRQLNTVIEKLDRIEDIAAKQE
jgi:hypothetical protein